MEFKFRATDQQAPMHNRPLGSFSYFAEQAIRAGYSGPDLGREEFFRNPNDMREAIQRELEKERIREEIIAAEIARRRILEAEVRREMLLEREMALRRTEGFSIFPGSETSLAMRFDPRISLLNQSEGRPLEERLTLALDERLGYHSRLGYGGLETSPFQRRISEVKPEVKRISEVRNEANFLAKSEGNLSGAKRKAVTPPAVTAFELPLVGKRRNFKEEWSCALCQVHATSERGLNDHLKGRKHKAKEAGLRARKAVKNHAVGLFQKQADNLNSKEKPEGQPLQVDKSAEVALDEKANSDRKQSNDWALQVIQDTKVSKNKNGDGENKVHKKNRFTFWCENCQVGAYSEKSMEAHKVGKKHVARLQELKQKGGAVLAAQEADAPQIEKDRETVSTDEREEIPQKVQEADGVAVENQVAEDPADSDSN